MPDVRYVCLSDLHFGAGNSLLSHIDDTSGRVDPTGPSRTLQAFVDCLATVIQRNEDQSVKPTLVLNGDILELALASDEVALMCFEQFVRLAMVERDLFDHHIVYLPGNHDHHVWETAREQAYAAYVQRHADHIGAPWHTTTMFRASDSDVAERRLAIATVEQELLRRHRSLHDATVEVRYPAFAVDGDGGRRAVVFHHGHLAESIYLLMSELKATTFPASEPARTLALIEAENFAWIDFFWSTLGRSGDWGTDVGVLYEMLQDREALRAVAANIGDRAGPSLPRYVPRRVGAWVTNFALRKLADKISDLERHRPVPAGSQLTATGNADLAAIVEGPMAGQLGDEGRHGIERLTFVYGHTHRPYSSITPFHGFPQPATVYNTGGWVVDTLDPDTLQGASAVLLDENLDAASVNLYRQKAGTPTPVSVSTAGGRPSPFSTRLSELVTPGAGPWANLEQQVADAIPRRYRALRRSIDRSVAEARKRPAQAWSKK